MSATIASPDELPRYRPSSDAASAITLPSTGVDPASAAVSGWVSIPGRTSIMAGPYSGAGVIEPQPARPTMPTNAATARIRVDVGPAASARGPMHDSPQYGQSSPS